MAREQLKRSWRSVGVKPRLTRILLDSLPTGQFFNPLNDYPGCCRETPDLEIRVNDIQYSRSPFTPRFDKHKATLHAEHLQKPDTVTDCFQIKSIHRPVEGSFSITSSIVGTKSARMKRGFMQSSPVQKLSLVMRQKKSKGHRQDLKAAWLGNLSLEFLE